MNIYVFGNVLEDYTPGQAVIAAETLEQAQALACEKFGFGDTVENFLAEEPGFCMPTGTYPTSGVEAGVLHYVYGGG